MKIGVRFSDDNYSDVWEIVLPIVANMAFKTKESLIVLIHEEMENNTVLNEKYAHDDLYPIHLFLDTNNILLGKEVIRELKVIGDDNVYYMDIEFSDRVFTKRELLEKGIYIYYMETFGE